VRAALAVALGLLLPALASGCLGGQKQEGRTDPNALPPGWDETAPNRSQLASSPYHTLTHSSSFILKGHTYGRYVVHVPEPMDNVQVFFTTGTRDPGPGPTPTLDDPDIYHFEFMQIRPLGRQVKSADVDALTRFGHAANKGVFTLTYLYGKNANHQFLAPYDGQPDQWRLEAGFYDFVLATDEGVTIGINIRTGSPYWTSYYHPQELGGVRAEALGFWAEWWETMGPRLPEVDRELRGIVEAAEGEVMNYFTFADVWYDARTLSVGATGSATVRVNGDTVPHHLAVQEPGPGRGEAYAFAMDFNARGPMRVDLRSHVSFNEYLSASSQVIAMLFVFGIVTFATETVDGVPAASQS
jgi:hypothetical protein